jgi:hypothetical protein
VTDPANIPDTSLLLEGFEDSSLDEYHNIALRYGLADIISQVRSFKLSIFLTCQYLSQMPNEFNLTLQQMNSLFTFNPDSIPSLELQIF